jgi:hypothetical protein
MSVNEVNLFITSYVVTSLWSHVSTFVVITMLDEVIIDILTGGGGGGGSIEPWGINNLSSTIMLGP